MLSVFETLFASSERNTDVFSFFAFMYIILLYHETTQNESDVVLSRSLIPVQYKYKVEVGDDDDLTSYYDQGLHQGIVQ